MLDFLSMVTTKWKGRERLVSCDSISPTPCRASPHPPHAAPCLWLMAGGEPTDSGSRGAPAHSGFERRWVAGTLARGQRADLGWGLA